MKILGIIAEYNPFHNGHKYHIEKSLEMTGADHVVAVMSGSFVQRGEPALQDKWKRARLACENGADLVLELPFIYACNGASQFARGAIGILDGLGCIDFLSFGSESGDLELLKKCAEEMRPALDTRERNYVKGMGDSLLAHGISSDANNILAIEYLKALDEAGSSMQPVTVKRTDAGYHASEIIGSFTSASNIRAMLLEGKDIAPYVPYPPSFDASGSFKDSLYRLIISEILRQDPELLEKLPSGGEGIGHKMKNCIREAEDYDALIASVKEGRYTSSRIQRVMIQCLMGLYGMPEMKYYARILAFNEKGQEILKHMRKEGPASEDFPIITNINKAETGPIDSLLQYDIRATDLYNLIYQRPLYFNSDMVRQPEIIQKKIVY